VFAKIGKGAVSNVLDGYNSTVFAYGQTGSGKTFTTLKTNTCRGRNASPSWFCDPNYRYVDRGIIPRALSLMFAEFKERSDQQFTCHISYLEIYNEQVLRVSCVPRCFDTFPIARTCPRWQRDLLKTSPLSLFK